MLDYHVHTRLCGHASGEVEDYIDAAINAGLVEIGFSDHAPLPEKHRSGITMSPHETETYLERLYKMRQVYSDRIEVKIGFEVDFPLCDSFDPAYFDDPRMDYLVGSCHFIDDWPFDHPDHIDEFSRRDINQVYERYYSIMGEMVRSGLFQVAGHFDLVKKFGHRSTRDFSIIIEDIARIMVKNDMAAEINTAGLRKPVGEIYPSENILRMFFDQNVPVTLGSDAHSPGEVAYMFKEALQTLRNAGYRYISGFTGKKRYNIPI
ncbi:MAG: histidinol-phosphatase HisJ family protein [Spirochaetota bacterium]